jgi:predicted GNAT superfamily acetyltransferase
MVARIEQGSIDAAYEAHRRIPEFADEEYERAEFQRRLGDKSALILIAWVDAAPVAFKVGYDRYHDGGWYSWLGGVQAEHRRDGIAAALIDRQEQWVRAAGYSHIVVKTRNQFVGMRILLARSGYMNVAVESPGGAKTPLEKLRLIHIKVL